MRKMWQVDSDPGGHSGVIWVSMFVQKNEEKGCFLKNERGVSRPLKRGSFCPKRGKKNLEKVSHVRQKGSVTGQQWQHNIHTKSVDAWNFGSNVSELGYRRVSRAPEQKGHNRKFGPEKGYDFRWTKSTKRGYFSNPCTYMLTQMAPYTAMMKIVQ